MFARHVRRTSYTSIASCLALALAAGTLTIAGCSTDESAPADAPPEATAHTSEALSSGGDLFAIIGSQLEQGSAGGAFTPAGDAYGVTALAGFHGHLYVASAGELWMRGAIGPGTGNDWTHVGAARGAVAMTYHQGQLYMVAQNQLWQRSAVVPGNDWTAVGDAYGVTGMASFAGQLYVASGNALWRRGAIGPGTGNDWSYAGDAYGVTAMASSGGHLYVVSNNKLWQRGLLGPGTGNDWTLAGDAPGITALTSFPVDCTAGFSAADCPSPDLDLTGLADVAIGHPATQSSTLAGQTPDRAVDADVTTASATNVEPSPWLSIDLSFDRSVKAVALSTDTAGAVVDLLDAAGTVVFSEPLSGFTSSHGMYIVGIAPVTARTVRVRASSTVSLNVREVQVFAPLLPAGVTRAPAGTCWKSTYGRGAGAPISSCDADQDEDGALCYPKCASGYYGVGPVCWQSCPSGWTDTGAFCHHDGSIISADNSSCPWYDECGLTFAWGCSTCPPGYANDGCTCRIDPQDFAKASYGRGAGVPLHCAANQEEQAALCYTPCSTGYDGVGPVCWSQCHGDFSVPCGSLACASSADACSGFVQETVDSTINFAVTVASLFGPSASLDTIGFAFSIANAVQIKGVKALTDEIANLIIAASLHTSLGGGGTISQELANTTAGAIVTALQTGKINWSLIDPTGLAAVIAAFDQPTC